MSAGGVKGQCFAEQNGEEACEGHGYNSGGCSAVGCCQYQEATATSGQCVSAIQAGQCLSKASTEDIRRANTAWEVAEKAAAAVKAAQDKAAAAVKNAFGRRLLAGKDSVEEVFDDETSSGMAQPQPIKVQNVAKETVSRRRTVSSVQIASQQSTIHKKAAKKGIQPAAAAVTAVQLKGGNVLETLRKVFDLSKASYRLELDNGNLEAQV